MSKEQRIESCLRTEQALLRRYRRTLHRFLGQGDLEVTLWYQWLDAVAKDQNLYCNTNLATLLRLHTEVLPVILRKEALYRDRIPRKKRKSEDDENLVRIPCETGLE